MSTTSTDVAFGRGVIVPICTPLDSADQIDTASLRRLVDHLVAHGVHGIFALGTTGEFGFLTDAQRALVVETCAEHLAGRLPLLVGISDTASERAIAQAERLIPRGADAVVATAPFFAATAEPEIRTHFQRIKQAIGETPLFAYENPPRVNGRSIPAEAVLDLGADGTLAGLKDSSGDSAYLDRVLSGREERGLDGFRVLTGSETHALDGLRAGADGIVPGLGNVDPAGYVRLYDEWESAPHEAKQEQRRLCDLFNIVRIPTHTPMGGSSQALGAFKAALRQLGVLDDDRCAPPSVLLDDSDRAAVAKLLASFGPAPRSARDGDLSAGDGSRVHT